MEAAYFRANRRKLLATLPDGALVVMAGYGERQRRDDMAQFFEQESNFWYLSGVETPDWQLIIDGATGHEWLVAPTIDSVKAAFDGSLDPAVASAVSGIKEVIDGVAATQLLQDLSRRHRTVYTTAQPAYLRRHTTMQLDTVSARLQRRLKQRFATIESCNTALMRLRAIKQPAEIEALRAAVALTAAAFGDARDSLPAVRHEYELDAVMTARIRRGAARHGYDPIVAGNGNACTLHYVRNDGSLIDGSLVLIDVGARRHGFSADITRTYAKGNLTARQRDVHRAVREAQAACIELLRPGLSLRQLQSDSDTIMTRAVRSLDLPVDNLREYMPHALGHGLGIDVHEGLAYGELQPGMVMTIEPGIYLPDEAIGVRIEDDILITPDGHDNLSASLSTSL